MFCRFLVVLFLLTFHLHAASVEEALNARQQWDRQVWRADVRATWMDDGHFWYRVQTGPASHEFVRVDAADGSKKKASSREGIGLPPYELLLSSKSEDEIHPSKNGGASTTIVFVNRSEQPVQMVWINAEGEHKEYAKLQPGGEFRQNTFAGHVWLVRDESKKPLAVVKVRTDPLKVEIDGPSAAMEKKGSNAGGTRSPDGKWAALMDDGKLMLRDLRTGKTVRVKADIETRLPFRGGIHWAPDSSCFVVSCAAATKRRVITIVDSSPKGQVQPKLREVDYAKAGDDLPQPVPVIIRLTADGYESKEVKPELFRNAFIQTDKLDVRWAPDSSEFYFDFNERGHQRYRIIGVHAATAAARVVVEETSKTFIDYTHKTWRHWLDKTGELLWMSERDGWCHLWLYEVSTGQVKQQVTQGPWVVRSVVRVDEPERQIWFMASGLRPGEDPYHEHLCRIAFDGTGFQQMTQGDGQHGIEWSPNKKHFIDSWSRVDRLPVTELRRSEDGSLVCILEEADGSALLATGWQMPERFVAKGRDGKTDIHGIIIKPPHFDPAKKYPVLEQIYAGPHSAFVPKEFNVLVRQHEMAAAGFVVVQADGMGTNHRGKAFHDVCWKNLKDAGFPDRIAWTKAAAAANRPWMDLQRVGIYGGSAGGQSAMRALLDHHDFYQTAVADCGCHDNRMDKIWWNEQWLGWPVDESYRRSSNVEDAAKLQGHLLLIVGEMDVNVDPATTSQVVHALQKAGKSFDYMPIMGAGHGAAETPFGNRLRLEFLVRHLKP